MILKNLRSGEKYEVEVADSFLKKAVGLSWRRSMGKKKGMLFVFGKEGRPRFWMLGMRFPIDIIFVKSDKTVSEVSKAIPLTMNPKTWKNYYPKGDIRYVLELQDSDFREGDKVEW